MEDAISEAEIAPCLLALAVARLSLHLWQKAWRGEERPARSQLTLLWYSLSPLFCEPARLRVSLEPLAGKFSFSLSLSGYPTVWVAISH